MNRIIANLSLNAFWTVEIHKTPLKLSSDEMELQLCRSLQEVIHRAGWVAVYIHVCPKMSSLHHFILLDICVKLS